MYELKEVWFSCPTESVASELLLVDNWCNGKFYPKISAFVIVNTISKSSFI